MTIYNEYFKLTAHHRKEHGDNTVILMQIGGFYEVYGCRINGVFSDVHSKLYDISRKCDLKIADKSDIVDNGVNATLCMIGFRIYSIEKYLHIIINSGYACVVYDQDEQKSGTTRSLQAVYTPGMYFDEQETIITNTIVSCWLHKFKNNLIVGLSCINILTGKCYIYEYETFFELSHEVFDDLERFISTFTPNELIIIHNMNNLVDTPKLLNLCNVSNSIRTIVVEVPSSKSTSSLTPSITTKRAINCEKQIYQDEIYKKFFNDKLNSHSTTLLTTYVIASQSFCFLLDYIYQNNPHLVTNIEEPIFENNGDRVLLGNHSLKQLNIITIKHTNKSQTNYDTSCVESYSEKTTLVKKRLSSVCDLLNYCKTSMGSRLFHYTMTHPHTNITILNTIYDTTLYCKNIMEVGKFNTIIESLIAMFDIEKIVRKVFIQRSSYDDITKLYTTLRETVLILSKITTDTVIMNYFKTICKVHLKKVFDYCNNQINYLEGIFTSQLLSGKKSDDINIYNIGIYKDHDAIVFDNYKCRYVLRVVYHYINDQMKLAEQAKVKKTKVYKRDPIKINETERGSITIETTSARSKILMDFVKTKDKMSNYVISEGVESQYHKKVIDEGVIPNYLLENTDFIAYCFEAVTINPTISIDKASSQGSKSITNTSIQRLLKNTQQAKEALEKSVGAVFKQFNDDFKSIVKDYTLVSKFCGTMDMLVCYTLVAKTMNYCKPIIKIQTNSFCSFKGLRHPLIEHLIENELYVANSIQLNDSIQNESFNNGQGFLLYGTNTVGKSSFIKSIGIATIMAQCGFFVAAENMVFKPFKSIYTRILGNDNLFQGLSTFNVEMIELKNILNFSDQNSLVLGDEVCSGTEMGSASSIFMTALEHLYANKTKYIFATHFHNIVDYKEMTSLDNMKNIHLSVCYDIEQDRLVYDRKLKPGSGENMYGLEVCKSLHLPDTFIKRAYEIRNKYFSINTSLLDFKASKYNARKIVGNCEVCGKKGTEVHHLQHQRDSNDEGFIKNDSISTYFHKNKKANLMVLCDDCHCQLHKESASGHYRISNNRLKTT